MDGVLAAGRTILLRSNANRSTGGTPFDVLSRIHPEIRRMAEELAAAAGFRATGIDYLTPDISRSHSEVGGGSIEFNATPGMFVHLAAGMTEAEIGSLFLGTSPARYGTRTFCSRPIGPCGPLRCAAPALRARSRRCGGRSWLGLSWRRTHAPVRSGRDHDGSGRTSPPDRRAADDPLVVRPACPFRPARGSSGPHDHNR